MGCLRLWESTSDRRVLQDWLLATACFEGSAERGHLTTLSVPYASRSLITYHAAPETALLTAGESLAGCLTPPEQLAVLFEAGRKYRSFKYWDKVKVGSFESRLPARDSMPSSSTRGSRRGRSDATTAISGCTGRCTGGSGGASRFPSSSGSVRFRMHSPSPKISKRGSSRSETACRHAPFSGVAGFWISELYSPWNQLPEIVLDGSRLQGRRHHAGPLRHPEVSTGSSVQISPRTGTVSQAFRPNIRSRASEV